MNEAIKLYTVELLNAANRAVENNPTSCNFQCLPSVDDVCGTMFAKVEGSAAVNSD